MNNEKAVVITGASGFIGSNVAKLFVDSGFTVINIHLRLITNKLKV